MLYSEFEFGVEIKKIHDQRYIVCTICATRGVGVEWIVLCVRFTKINWSDLRAPLSTVVGDGFYFCNCCVCSVRDAVWLCIYLNSRFLGFNKWSQPKEEG